MKSRLFLNALLIVAMLFSGLPIGVFDVSAASHDVVIDRARNEVGMQQSSDGEDYQIYLPLIVNGSAEVTNEPPVAKQDYYVVDEDSQLQIAAPGVLHNDSDADSDALTAILVQDPEHGGISLNPNGSFTYIPDKDFFGTDTFTYRANDGIANSNVAVVTITVRNVNDSPTAVDDTYTVEKNQTLDVRAPGVLANDIEVDGDSMLAALTTNVSHGVLVFMSDGSFTYSPEENYVGQDSFGYRLVTYL